MTHPLFLGNEMSTHLDIADELRKINRDQNLDI